MIDRYINDIDKVICKNIEKLNVEDRGLLAQNILSQLRNFVEHISLKIFSDGYSISVNYQNIGQAIDFVKTRGELRFLSRFHQLLQITASHYTLDEENSERLMLKYYEYLIRTKTYLKSNFDLDILANIGSFPIHLDSNLKEYYEKIAEKINQPSVQRIRSQYNDRYYIQKVKPFFVGFEIYYQVTFTRATDYVSKFDRIIAFTKLEVSPNYAVRLDVSLDYIEILERNMPIQIIDNWEVSIRPCEINNFARIFNRKLNISGKNIEFMELNKHLTLSGMNLVEVVDASDGYFKFIKGQITSKSKSVHIFQVLDDCRKIIKQGKRGKNILRYLLFGLNNKIIKKQFNDVYCPKLSNLKLSFGCIPFDDMPFNSSLINHNPKLRDLFDCISIEGRTHELFARLIKNNTETKSQLYTLIEEVSGFEGIDNLIHTWNSTLYYRHTNRRLEIFKNHIYFTGYEEDTLQIVEYLRELSLSGVKNYSNSVESWLNTTSYVIDSIEKKTALKQIFENSKVGLVYGAAGTGKSTMINHLSNFFNDESKLFLANTNPAIDNLKRKVNAANCSFKTIASFLYSSNVDFDLLIVDECSTVSNADMKNVLNRATFRLLVLVGDVFQIESILFGNWFNLISSFIPKSSVFELTQPYRTSSTDLLNLWNRVRNIDDNILECITKNDYSVSLDESIFEHTDEDEIILCLNYDGLYGINNINTFLQSNNTSPSVVWGTHVYKANDPIIFNDTERFSPLLYNNLKGRIVDITALKDRIQFEIEVDKVINAFDADIYDFELMDNAPNGNSIIKFVVTKYKSTDEDNVVTDDVVPFQVAYAVSIHKAQGLEYRSVKVVITEEVEEMISHNIFYTAITRAREKLKIYWTPETENRVLKGLEKKSKKRDVILLKTKHGL